MLRLGQAIVDVKPQQPYPGDAPPRLWYVVSYYGKGEESKKNLFWIGKGYRKLELVY